MSIPWATRRLAAESAAATRGPGGVGECVPEPRTWRTHRDRHAVSCSTHSVCICVYQCVCLPTSVCDYVRERRECGSVKEHVFVKVKAFVCVCVGVKVKVKEFVFLSV